MYKKRDGECNEEIFWECVTEIGWPSRSSSVIKRDLIHAWNQDFSESFRKIFGEKTRQVGKALDEYEERNEIDYYLGDDSFSDLSAHVVGLGKDVFSREVDDTELLVKRIKASDYKESFAYCIPYAGSSTKSFEDYMTLMGYPMDEEGWSHRNSFDGDPLETFEEYMEHMREDHACARAGDWRNIEHEHYVNMAKPYQRRCEIFVKEMNEQGSLSEVEKDAVQLASELSSFFQNLNTDASESALSNWWKLYMIMQSGELRDKHAKLLPMAGNRMYGGENLINDFRFYIGNLERFKCMHHYKEMKKVA